MIYRYNQLPKAIENARKLGFKEGAALFPQVTYSGEECHSEWEITFEEIHRNNIIVYAIAQHAAITGSKDYIAKYGLEVMIAVSRFWSQRVSLLPVIAACCVRRVTNLRQQEEAERWRDIINRMYLPEDKELGIFVQNDGFLDKELNSTDAIPPEERPINQHWSWDRILRSCYIKQSDVLLGLYLYYFNFDKETVRRNFDFYETMTVHESSLSPHIHSILAARIGEVEKAYQLFLHATRLDLDDYNNETHQGLHITSMPGSWLAIVRGFAGMQILEGILSFFPVIPEKWSSYSFQINYQGRTLQMRVGKEINISLITGEELNIQVYKNVYKLKLGTDLLLRIEE